MIHGRTPARITNFHLKSIKLFKTEGAGTKRTKWRLALRNDNNTQKTSFVLCNDVVRMTRPVVCLLVVSTLILYFKLCKAVGNIP